MTTSAVTPGFMPGIHVFTIAKMEDVDGPDKPGHDKTGLLAPFYSG
jgi:hypothetical protein